MPFAISGDLTPFACGAPAHNADLHPALHFRDPVGRIHVQIKDVTPRPPVNLGTAEPLDRSPLWEADFDLRGAKDLPEGLPPLPSSLLPRIKSFCGIKNENLQMKVIAEPFGQPPDLKDVWPYGASVGNSDEDFTKRPLDDKQRPGPLVLPTVTTGREPNARICTTINVKRHDDESLGLPTPRNPNGLKVILPFEVAQWLNKYNYDQIHPPPPPEDHPSTTSFASDPLFEKTPNYRNQEEIRITQLQNGSIARGFHNQAHACGFSKNYNSCHHAIDPSGARDAWRFSHKTPAYSSSQMEHHRFFWGKHDSDHFVHPGITFKHPAHYAKIKMWRFFEGHSKPPELVYDADFEVAGHAIASDQKPIGGTIQKFPGFVEPDLGKSVNYQITVEADIPNFAPNFDSQDVDYAAEALAAAAAKKVSQTDKAISMSAPTPLGAKTRYEPPQKHPASERFTDFWRKADFAFSIKSPAITDHFQGGLVHGLLKFL